MGVIPNTGGMTMFTNRVARIAVACGMAVCWLTALAQSSSVMGPTLSTYQTCTTSCQSGFPFTERSDPSFAQMLSTCIDGCAVVDGARLPVYEACHQSCKKTFRFRHSQDPRFADFQSSCIRGCRSVRK